MITIRASSLSDLFDCPARFEARQIRGLRMPSGSGSVIGKAVHAGTAAFDQARIDQSPISIDDTTGLVVDAIHKPDEEVDWGDDSPNEAEQISIALHDLYCRKIAPLQTYVAVEAKCDRLDIKDIGISLTGTTDRVYQTENGEYGIGDIKTGKAAVSADGTVKTQGHAVQMAVYGLIASQAIGQSVTAPAKIIGLQSAKTDKGRRAGIGTIEGAQGLLIGTDEQPGALEHAAQILKSGLFHGNPRSQICHAKYCPVFNSCFWRK